MHRGPVEVKTARSDRLTRQRLDKPLPKQLRLLCAGSPGCFLRTAQHAQLRGRRVETIGFRAAARKDRALQTELSTAMKLSTPSSVLCLILQSEKQGGAKARGFSSVRIFGCCIRLRHCGMAADLSSQQGQLGSRSAHAFCRLCKVLNRSPRLCNAVNTVPSISSLCGSGHRSHSCWTVPRGTGTSSRSSRSSNSNRSWRCLGSAV